MGRWIGERLNRMEAPVRFFLPEGGVSALDVAGGAFFNPAADAALFTALERTVRQTTARQLIRVPCQHQRSDVRRRRRAGVPVLAWRPQWPPAGGEVSDATLRTRSTPREIPRHDRARRADHRRRRRHRPVGEMRGGRRHRSHRHLQFRPLPHGRARLARRPDALWRRQPDRRGDGRPRCCRS